MHATSRNVLATSLERLGAALTIGLGAVMLFGAGCGANGGSSSGDLASGLPNTGTSMSRLRVGLTSSTRVHGGGGPVHDLQEAHVLIDRVTAHTSGGWVTVRDGIAVDVDVLRLGDSSVDLGFADLPPGEINQIRLHVSTATVPYVITAAGDRVLMKVPSGEESGLKIKGVFTATACEQLTVMVDLDSPHAIQIHPTGHHDLYVLRPVIRASGESTPLDQCTPADPQDPNGGGGTTTDPQDPNGGTTDPQDPNGGTTGGDGSGSPDPGTGGTGGDGSGTVTPPADGSGGTSGTPTDGSGSGTPTDGSGGTTTPPDGSGSTGGTSGTPTDGGSTGGTTTCTSDADCSISSYCATNGSCISV